MTAERRKPEVIHVRTIHELYVTEDLVYGGHTMQVTIVQGRADFAEISLKVHDEEVMKSVSLRALQTILRIYDSLPIVESSGFEKALGSGS